MPLFKAFSSADVNGELAALEQTVNDWFRRERPRILTHAQSAFGQHLVVTFVYDRPDTERAGAVAEAETAVPPVFERTLAGADLDPSETHDVPLPEAELPY